LPEFEGCPDAKTLKVIVNAAEKKALLEAKQIESQKLVVEKNKEVLDFKVEPVLFETNSAEISSQYQSILNEVVKLMNENPRYRLQLSGHADSQGSDIYNQQLSEMRAKACFLYLRTKELSTDRMFIKGFGEKNPAGDNLTEEGRQQNRRVDLKAYR